MPIKDSYPGNSEQAPLQESLQRLSEKIARLVTVASVDLSKTDMVRDFSAQFGLDRDLYPFSYGVKVFDCQSQDFPGYDIVKLEHYYVGAGLRPVLHRDVYDVSLDENGLFLLCETHQLDEALTDQIRSGVSTLDNPIVSLHFIDNIIESRTGSEEDAQTAITMLDLVTYRNNL